MYYTNLSDIYSIEETFVEFYVFYSHQQYYNRIKVNNDYINIAQNSNKIKFKIDATDRNEIFEQKFIYEKINGEKIEQSYEFYLEINKGKLNSFVTFLKKDGGKTFQLYFQTKKSELLPKDVNIKVNENDHIKIDIFDDFECSLRKRMTIINAIDQDFFDKERLDSYEKLSNIKILYVIKDDGQKDINNIFQSKTKNIIINTNNSLEKKTDILNENVNENVNENDSSIYIFEYNKDNIQKERFSIKKDEEEKINRIFEKLYADEKFIDILDEQNTELRRKLYSIFLNDEIKIKEYCLKGFTNYIFLNTKKNYDFIKKLLLLLIYFKYCYIDTKIQNIINFMKNLFSQIKNGDYLEKIQVLLYLFEIIYFDKPLENNYILDVFDENQNKYNLYKEPSSKAFKLFMK